jgi:ubiquinone biosynthesis protein
VAISLRPQHLRRYGELARLLRKYGRSDLVTEAGLPTELDDRDDGAATGQEEQAVPAEATELAADLERLGPTYIKLGQLLSTRADLLPPPYLEALSRLQDDVEPIPTSEVEQIVARQLGARISDLFADFEREPMASASLGQVHSAALRDGRRVAVKVQRPGIRQQVSDDLEVLGELAEFLDEHTEAGRTFGFVDLLEQFRRSLFAELDYRREAENLRAMRRHLERFDRIVVPAPVDDYTTGKVLTMELIDGRKVTSVGPLGKMDIDGSGLADELFAAYLEQILGAGFIHADPHPGNVLVTPDGRLGLVDLGMVTHVGHDMQEHLVKLLLAVGEGRGTDVADLAEEMGLPLARFDRRQLRRETVELVARHHGAELSQVGAGTIVADLLRICASAGLRPPPELSLMGKALLNLDEVARVLDPGFRPQEAMRHHATALFQQRAWRSASSANLMRTALETREFVEQLPKRANRLLDALADGELSIKVDAVDEEELLRDLEKIGNRITTGVILAAVIVGAAMTMRVDTDSQILGYPSISIVFFVLAALGGLALVVVILVSDRRTHRRQADPD